MYDNFRRSGSAKPPASQQGKRAVGDQNQSDQKLNDAFVMIAGADDLRLVLNLFVISHWFMGLRAAIFATRGKGPFDGRRVTPPKAMLVSMTCESQPARHSLTGHNMTMFSGDKHPGFNQSSMALA